MSKSYLKSFLLRAAQIARRSLHQGIPIDEYLHQVQSAQVSRRTLLRTGLAVGGAVAGVGLNQVLRPDRASATSRSSILILGAGIAGLTAAYRLRQAGVVAEIVEARSAVGGRMKTLQNALGTSTGAELGGEFIDTGHDRIRSLAGELGVKLQDLTQTDTGLTLDTFYFQGRKIDLAEVTQAFIPLIPKLERDAALLDDLTTPTAIALDQLSITAYLAKQPISGLLRSLLEVAYTLEFGREASEQSCFNLIDLIGKNPNRFEAYGDSDEHFHIIGGNGQIPQKLAKRLSNAITIETELEQLKLRSDGRYRASFRSGGRSFERTYERVLLTVPFSVLRRIELDLPLPQGKRRAIDRLGYGTNSKVIGTYSEAVWKRYGAAGSVFTDLPSQGGWEATRYATSRTRLYTNFTGGIQGRSVGAETPEFQAQRVATHYNRIFPGMEAAYQGKAVRAYWTGQSYSRGSYSCYLVGQWTSISGEEQPRVGNLFFAGEHCSAIAQGYMEGGCETGEAAAREILADLGVN